MVSPPARLATCECCGSEREGKMAGRQAPGRQALRRAGGREGEGGRRQAKARRGLMNERTNERTVVASVLSVGRRPGGVPAGRRGRAGGRTQRGGRRTRTDGGTGGRGLLIVRGREHGAPCRRRRAVAERSSRMMCARSERGGSVAELGCRGCLLPSVRPSAEGDRSESALPSK